jgi:hypothetical protein
VAGGGGRSGGGGGGGGWGTRGYAVCIPGYHPIRMGCCLHAWLVVQAWGGAGCGAVQEMLCGGHPTPLGLPTDFKPSTTPASESPSCRTETMYFLYDGSMGWPNTPHPHTCKTHIRIHTRKRTHCPTHTCATTPVRPTAITVQKHAPATHLAAEGIKGIQKPEPFKCERLRRRHSSASASHQQPPSPRNDRKRKASLPNTSRPASRQSLRRGCFSVWGFEPNHLRMPYTLLHAPAIAIAPRAGWWRKAQRGSGRRLLPELGRESCVALVAWVCRALCLCPPSC